MTKPEAVLIDNLMDFTQLPAACWSSIVWFVSITYLDVSLL